MINGRTRGGWKAVALACAIPLLLTACTPPVGEKAGLSRDAAELFRNIPDGDYLMLGYIDFTNFVGSEFGQKVIEFSPSGSLWDEKLGIGYDQVDRAVFAMRFQGDFSTESSEVIMILSSPLSEEDILTRLDTKADYFEKEDLEGTSFYKLQDFGFAQPRDGLIAIGTPDLVRSAVRLAKGEGKAHGVKGILRRFKEDLRQDDSFWVGIDGINKFLIPISQRETLLKGFTTLKSGFLAVSFDEDAKFRGLVTCEDEESAAKIASSLSTLVGMLNFLIKQAEFSDLPPEVDADRLRNYLVTMLDTVDIRSRGNDIVINFTAASDIIDFLAEVTKEIVTVDGSQQ